jgi:hypothetical protein
MLLVALTEKILAVVGELADTPVCKMVTRAFCTGVRRNPKIPFIVAPRTISVEHPPFHKRIVVAGSIRATARSRSVFAGL